MRWARWRSGEVSITEIERMQPAGNDYYNHVDQAAEIGIGETDRVFSAATIEVARLAHWLEPTSELEMLMTSGLPPLGPLVAAWRDGPVPPPVIAVRYADGSAMGLDGFHRLNAAAVLGLEVIPAWLASEDAG